jgi:Fic family protein
MEQLVLRYKNWETVHPIVRAAYLHTEFIKIHPFFDGNGRTARLLMNFELMAAGYPPIVIKKEDRIEYYKHLDYAAKACDYTSFITFILEIENQTLDFYLKYLD